MRKTANSTIPTLEVLESREVPAVQILASNHLLHIIGDGKADTIAISDNGRGTIKVRAGTESVTLTDIHGILINGGSGADKVTYDLTGKLMTTEVITAWLGGGADTATFNLLAGVGKTGHLKLNVHGGAGADHEWVGVGSIDKGGSAVVGEYGGRGNDHISFHAIGHVGGRLAVMVRGGAGKNWDSLVVDAHIVGSGTITISGK